MRKTFTTVLFLAVALCLNAENRRWDFTSWSSETVTNLMEGDDWSDIEKSTASAPTTLSENNCFWEVSAMGTSEGVTLTANGTAIAELEGLLYTNTNSRSLAIAVNYQNASETDAAFQNYHGPSYLWLGSSDKAYFVIPNVKPGATINMAVESHKTTDARGVNLYLGYGSSGTQLKDANGNDVNIPTAYEELSWYVPTDANDATNDDGTYNIQIVNTNGCHIYYIEVVEDAPDVSDATIAYLYDSQYEGYSTDYDDIRQVIISEENPHFSNVTIADIDVSGDVSAIDKEALMAYDVVVVSGAIAADHSFAATIKEAVSYVPMVSFNPWLYSAWGYGEAVTTSTGDVTVGETYINHELFTPSDETAADYVEADGTLNLFSDPLTGVNLAADGLFANDAVLATADGVTAIHMHNSSRNMYIYLPYTYENTSFNQDNVIDIITNAVKLANFSAIEVTAAATPTFTETYKNLSTDVAISCSTTGATIYYTTDGSDPTNASTLYTEPFNVAEEGVTVKAVAYADGYNPSEVAELAVSIYTTSAVPTITATYEEGKTTVTIENNEPDADVYYNFTGSTATNESSKYTTAVEITYPTTIYAFATAVTGKMASETVSMHVAVEGKTERTLEISHFDANAADWSLGGTKTTYYCDGEKSGYNYYNIVGQSTVTGSDGQDSIVYELEPANILTVVNPGGDWQARSYGQGMLWEQISVSTDIDDNNTTSRYRGETVFDQGASANSVTSGNVQKSDGVNNDPYSFHIRSNRTFQGPFDIVVYVANGSSSNQPKATIQVNTDTLSEEGWQVVDTVYFSKTQRYIKKNVLSYEGTDEVFVKLQAEFSSIMVMDIIILGEGETTGIESVATAGESNGRVVKTLVYSVNGTRLAEPAKGLNIIKEVMEDGTSRVRKVVVK